MDQLRILLRDPLTGAYGQVVKLMGAHEIRMRLGGISRQRVYAITSHRSFPVPVAELQQGNVWLAEDVERWIREHRPELADRSSAFAWPYPVIRSTPA